jgi:MFS family permease
LPVSTFRAWWTMAVLSLAYVFSIVDRQILTLLIDPIRNDLAITDTEVSLLTGAAFGIVYAISAVPIARIADRGSRKTVLMSGIAMWGTMTALCGLARSFWPLFVGRMGVGLGEAALTPSGYSLTAELFPPHKRARAMSVFVVGGAIGGGLSLLIGAFAIGAAERWGTGLPFFRNFEVWQVVFILLGLTTLLILPLMATIATPSAAPQQTAKPIRAIPHIWANRKAFMPHFIGLPLIGLSSFGVAVWAPSRFIRDFGWSPAEAGFSLGAVLVVAGLGGAIWSAIVADHLRKRGRADASLWLLIISTIAGVPLLVASMSVEAPTLALVLFATFSLVQAGMNTLGPAALLSITPDGMRAEVSALFLMVANLLGIGLGPTVVALVSDYLLGGSAHIGFAVIVVCGSASLLGAFIAILGLGDYRRAAEAETQNY